MAHLYPQAVGVTPITRLTLALADAASEAPLDAPVPTCPGWNMGDLVWHLTEVQDFWTYIIATRPGGPKNYLAPNRPAPNRLVANLRNAVAGLGATLKAAPPTDQAWTWSEEQTVAFTLRRQTHEALTHCIDGLLSAGLPLPEVSPELAADGIDEVLHVMIRDIPSGEKGTITLHTTDTDDSWSIRVGAGEATVTGTAFDMNLWLWGRGKTWPLTVSGATDQTQRLRAAVAART